MGKAIETHAPAENLLAQDDASSRSAALADIFDCFYKPVYNYIRYRINDCHEAEDITCQVFEQMMRKIASFCPERAPFEVWMFSIARNAVNDYYRQLKLRTWFSLEKVTRQPGPEGGSFEDCLLGKVGSIGHEDVQTVSHKLARGHFSLRVFVFPLKRG